MAENRIIDLSQKWWDASFPMKDSGINLEKKSRDLAR
jgi:hypothetical protein